ncbi:MAG: YlbF family regulator [Roseburia sp.]|nr:YlbF family regulator [Anaeroplasma bactoclasticum]MCM1195457.1 YlbF family regulator [Roseburia sp.]MCM1555936.1 YlbF family regulator [Anaeroplasma bactoclasticum]
MNDLKQAIISLPLVQRIKELERVLDSDKELNTAIQRLKSIQKQMASAKEFQQSKQYALYKKDYDELNEWILDFPFVEEYVELLEEANDLLQTIAKRIESKINEKLRD